MVALFPALSVTFVYKYHIPPDLASVIDRPLLNVFQLLSLSAGIELDVDI